MDVIISPNRLDGVIDAVSNKSYSYRIILASFLANEKTEINIRTISEDIKEFISCLKNVGAKISTGIEKIAFFESDKLEETEIDIKGKGIFIKYLLPILSALKIKATFISEDKIVKPKIENVYALKSVGITGEKTPFTLTGSLISGEFNVEDFSDSQFISSLIMALPILDGDSKLVCQKSFINKSYVKITLDVLNTYSIKYKIVDDGIMVFGNQKYISPSSITVEGDYLASSFIQASNTFGNRVRITNLNEYSFQSNKNIKEFVLKFNAEGTILDVKSCPDFAYMLTVCSAFACSDTTINNIPQSKDNTFLIFVENMKKLGANITVDEKNNSLSIKGNGGLVGGVIVDSHNDGKSAIALALATCFAQNPVTILSAQSANKVYPFFFNDFKALGGLVKVL